MANAAPLVYIWLEQEVYAMPMLHLLTVHEDVPVVPVPCVPAFVAGVANIRGRVMPVIDLARLLEVEALPQASEGYILVVTCVETQEVVFQISRISDSTATTHTSLKPLPEMFDIPYPQFIAGLLPDGTPLLNVPAILKSPVIVVNDSSENPNSVR
jgi:purine-binding chemotaxis protein CheW